MADDGEKVKIHRGLIGVYFDRSPATLIDGRAGELRYRGYSIHDLARHSSFEETAYLLLEGELPTLAELDAFDGELVGGRHGLDIAALGGDQRLDVDAGHLKRREHRGRIEVEIGVGLGHLSDSWGMGRRYVAGHAALHNVNAI